MRKEIKYQINYREYRYILRLLEIITKKDKNSNEHGEYKIRTMYFDNYKHEIQNNKKNDINSIDKYRIRMYNNQDEKVFLERKTNENGYIKKEKENINKQYVVDILNGNYENLIEENSKLKTELYLKINLKQFRPIIIIEYKRKAFIDELSKVRITLDKGIKSTTNCNKFFEEIETLPSKNVYILEIKYEKYLPEYIKNIIINIEDKKMSKSKFSSELKKKSFWE